jgi:hypothetical protein
MKEPYRYRVNGFNEPRGLTTVWAFEQESKPGNFVRWTDTLEDGSLQVETSCRVVSIHKEEEASDWGIPRSEMLVEIIERKSKRRLHNPVSVSVVAFEGCGRRQNPIFILRATGKLSALRNWTEKCGAERGIDSGQYFICSDCAFLYGYSW